MNLHCFFLRNRGRIDSIGVVKLHPQHPHLKQIAPHICIVAMNFSKVRFIEIIKVLQNKCIFGPTQHEGCVYQIQNGYGHKKKIVVQSERYCQSSLTGHYCKI